MDNATYQRTQDEVLEIAKKILTLPLVDFVQQISRAQALGPILDPTLYRKGMGNLSALETLSREMLKVQIAAHKLVGAVIDTAAKGDMQMPEVEE